MQSSLNNDDRRALDLLLDRASMASGPSSSPVAFAAAMVDPARIAGAERVLKLLSLLPADEPRADLLELTLRRVRESTASLIPGMPLYVGVQADA